MTQTLVAQLLWFHVVIEADHDFVDSLRFLTNSAHHNFEPHLAMRYRIKRKGSSVEVHDGFDQLFSGKSVAEVSEALRTHMLRRLFQYASLCGWVRLRAACVDEGGQRALLIGPPGSGKTAEAIRRGFAGATVGGDESVFIRAGRSIAVPTRFMVSVGTDELRGVAAPIVDAPVVGNGSVRALDPTRAGIAWEVGDAPVDCATLLVGPPGLFRITRAADSAVLLQPILEQTMRCVEPSRRIVAEVSQLLRSAELRILESPVPVAGER